MKSKLIVLLSIVIGSAPMFVFADENVPNHVDVTREALDKWVETRHIISQEKNDWKIAQEMLNERIEIVNHEIETLQGKISDAQKNINDADTKRSSMLDDNEKLKVASKALNTTVGSLENLTTALLKKLPDPIRDRVKPLSQRFPDNPEETKLSLSERFQNIIGILNEVNKFNREITTTSEVHTLPDGTSTEVTALYIGIGRGYYVSANGKLAGIGSATDRAWVWKPMNKAAPQIANAISILKNEKVASFVQLPIEVK